MWSSTWCSLQWVFLAVIFTFSKSERKGKRRSTLPGGYWPRGVNPRIHIFYNVGNTTATTLTCNEEGQWVYGRSPLEYSEYFVEQGLGTLTTGLIYQSAIVLNESFFNTYNDGTWTEVIRHEMGHAIGLRHPWETSEYPNGNYPEDPAALMYPLSNDNWLTFTNWDLNELYKTYPQEEAHP